MLSLFSPRRRGVWLAVISFGLVTLAIAAPRVRPPIAGPIFNLDSTQFFFEHRAAEMSGETVDAYVDLVASLGARTFISCVNAQKANYASRVWEPDWSGYDPQGPDNQAVLRYIPAAAIPATRQRLESAKKLADLGINLHARLLKRCRERGLGAWVSVRMNDVHDCLLEDSSLLSAFYKEQRAAGQLRALHRGSDWWADRGLDWSRPEVRDHYLKFVLEQLETLDLDGIELDWMRFVYHFRPGHELEGGQIITEWMTRVRAACDRAATRLGHPVQLGVRVPTRPETARRSGFDAVAWARAGLVDLVVPTPFWTTTDFDVPVIEWKRLLEGTGVQLSVGLEIRYQPVPNGPAVMMGPELSVGAALPVLHGGADAVYLFNYDPLPLLRMKTPEGGPLWTMASLGRFFRASQSLAALAAEPRLHAVAFHDVRAPGEPADNALPAVDSGVDFPWPPGCAVRIQTGPKPAGRGAELRVQFADGSAVEKLRVFVNSVECAPATGVTGLQRTYPVAEAVLQDEAQVIEFVSAKGTPFKVVRVEMFVAGAK